MNYSLYFDGGAQPNPGPCAGAFVIYKNGRILHEGGVFYEQGTNNIGEYSGLILGLECCVQHGYHQIAVYGDSLLVIEQMRGKWRVKNERLAELFRVAKELTEQLQIVEFNHVRRELNSYADSLSDRTLEFKQAWRLDKSNIS